MHQGTNDPIHGGPSDEGGALPVVNRPSRDVNRPADGQ